ncbi:MAG: hypothetical protein RLZZ08_1454 [Pseudomonadota bacterium]|jgi:hypothetical protein
MERRDYADIDYQHPRIPEDTPPAIADAARDNASGMAGRLAPSAGGDIDQPGESPPEIVPDQGDDTHPKAPDEVFPDDGDSVEPGARPDESPPAAPPIAPPPD